MTQRNPLNDRYNNADEKRTGKTRKSSASAKPKAQRAATVRDPAPKTKKQKKEEARERERKAAEKASVARSLFEDTPTYKRLRRFWWIALGVAIACTAASFAIQTYAKEIGGLAMALMVIAYSSIIFAFYLDFGKIRKERKLYNASVISSKSKEARREQKKIRAEQRAQEKEAAEKFEAAQAEEAQKESGVKGFINRFRKSPSTDATDTADASDKANTADTKTNETEK